MRNNLLPEMNKCFQNKDVSKVLFEQAERIDQDTKALNIMARDVAGSLSLDLPSRELREFLAHYPTALAWRVIEQLLLEKLDYKVGRLAALRVLAVINNDCLAAEFSGGHRISRSDGRLKLASVVS